MNAGARWYRTGSAITWDTAGGRGVGPAVIRYSLMYGFAGIRRARIPKGLSALFGERGGRVAVREEVVVRVHAGLPAHVAEHDVVEAARVLPGEEDRDAGSDRAHVGDD